MDYATLPPDELVVICFQARNESAWIEFVRRFHPLIARVVLRVALQWGEASSQVVDDLIQDTYLKLYQERSCFLQSFRPVHQNAVFGFIKVFTANLVHDHFKARHSQKRGSTLTTSLDAPSIAHDAGKTAASDGLVLDKAVLFREIESCLRTIATGTDGERDRRIFWLYYRVGLPASEIAALPSIGLSTKGVESTLMRLSRRIRERLVHDQTADLSRREASKGKYSAESL